MTLVRSSFQALAAISIAAALPLSLTAQAGDSPNWTPASSTAGFYQTDAEVREAINFNVGWRFFKGSKADAHTPSFNDENWEVVNLPHGLETLPLDASGCVNYQGVAWYRKQFTPPTDWQGQRIYVHFEGIMGKSKIWINGKLLKSHFGGFLPAHLDLTDHLKLGEPNVIAVLADNSNDPEYPPGKPQETLDFSYFGGIYRDVWLVKTGDVHFSNTNAVNETAGGGIFVHTKSIDANNATLQVDAHILNHSGKAQNVTVTSHLVDADGKTVGTSKSPARIDASGKVSHDIQVQDAKLWTPDTPYLHHLHVTIQDASGKTIDTLKLRVGIRTIEFKGRDGFWLNGKPYEHKLIGANRHQDYAHIGNALPNTTHWRDAKKLRDAGLRIIRNAHYPQDPAFMDACDELGLFVIVNTPGWQFWNPKPHFEQRVYSDVRNMVRRDRNRPSILLWEPILNETHYPAHFAQTVHNIVKEEYPYPGCYTACDAGAKGQEHFDVIFDHPMSNTPKINFWTDAVPNTAENRERFLKSPPNESRPIFTREWGDCVDNWNSHNSPSRVAVEWGEAAQLVQALHYSIPNFIYTAYDSLHHTSRQHFGGSLWHSFDHQRGYHPDPFWGGVMDAYRQPKYSYHMFKAQRDPQLEIPNVESGYFTFIANEMTPFSDSDVWVFSNCDEVRLKLHGEVIGNKSTKPQGAGMPHLPVVFEDVFDFMKVKKLNRARRGNDAAIVVEGLVDGKVVHTETRRPAMRRSQIILKPDYQNAALVADGSDIVPVVAYLADAAGNTKRLTNEFIQFKVTGEGSLVNDAEVAANPQKSRWGRAVALVRSTNTPGKITVTASVLRNGKNQPVTTSIDLQSIATSHTFLHSETPAVNTKSVKVQQDPQSQDSAEVEALRKKLQAVEKELTELKIKQVERQQSEFENGNQ
ncbi:glycoside hydrolase family 2 TIM barrel-domain containing protein [Sulfuriroseicoccus oceanibius]|uniref:Uncharacterized protein n=1 Tax=Sulfuriroseicoccus oceanibius TaxID=2707525 RepID=A0A6B3L2Q6_9BACT|nr:glycoside hydrolase family 2 TIM barrel-domain containing protein [Sulfuriroseicoccus oceanibius]QQL44491.1 hypothetical protein G3M56_011455 [Sulfuriroseicoccus oceanibius]